MSASGMWGPAPPGVDLTETQHADIIGSVVVIMIIGLSSVVLRLFTRLSHSGPGLAEDDYVIMVAAILGIGTAVCCLVSLPWGGGKHLWVVTADEFNKLYQTTYAFVIVYIACISATKTSILLFYRRMFGTGIIWGIVFALTIGHWAEVTITWLSGCRPVSYYWRQYTDPTAVGKCIDAPLFYFINGIIGLFIDVAILLVPIPTIIRLRMPPTKKIFVGGILLLGGFVCVASAVRIVMMDQLVKSPDFTWAMSKVFIWSCVEPFIGIVCACLPTYAPLVRRWWTAAAGSRGTGARSAGIISAGHESGGSGNGFGSHNKPGVFGPHAYVADVTAEKPRKHRHHHHTHSQWGKGLYTFGDTATLRGDDEIELTVDAAGREVPPSRGNGSPERDGGLKTEIVVRKDFTWTSTNV